MNQLSKIAEYAHPDVLVTTEWLKHNLDNVIVVESDEDILLYETGHIPGAVGALIAQPQHAELEIRASWAPTSFDLASHLTGWIELLALISGLPPKDSKVMRIS